MVKENKMFYLFLDEMIGFLELASKYPLVGGRVVVLVRRVVVDRHEMKSAMNC